MNAEFVVLVITGSEPTGAREGVVAKLDFVGQSGDKGLSDE
jgi:hypothetical protein